MLPQKLIITLFRPRTWEAQYEDHMEMDPKYASSIDPIGDGQRAFPRHRPCGVRNARTWCIILPCHQRFRGEKGKGRRRNGSVNRIGDPGYNRKCHLISSEKEYLNYWKYIVCPDRVFPRTLN